MIFQRDRPGHNREGGHHGAGREVHGLQPGGDISQHDGGHSHSSRHSHSLHHRLPGL